MPTIRENITNVALDLLDSTPEGLRYSELKKRILERLPGTKPNTVDGTIWNLDTRRPELVYKPARGLFRRTKYRETEPAEEREPEVAVPTKSSITEQRFYRPFADWLVNELEECTKAIPLGGNKFKDKWGTPDVIGIRSPKKSDIIKAPEQIVAAEIKTEGAGLITAFGQACSYRLFSHKVYIVVPKDSLPDDIQKLDALGRIFGVGLILFDKAHPDSPDFEIRVRAAPHEPDMFFVNKNLRLIEDELF